MSLGSLLESLKRYRLAFVASFVTLICATALFYILVPRQYTAETILAVGQSTSPSSERGTEETRALTALAQILQTNDVIREAAIAAGLEPSPTGAAWSQTFKQLDRAVTAKVDEKSNLLRITFKSADPHAATVFVEALASALIKAQANLMSRPGVSTLLEKRRQLLEDEARQAAQALAAYMSHNATYAIGTQRDLLLKRSSELAAALATTRISIADRRGQRRALTEQLRSLKPVTQSPFVSSLVDAFASDDKAAQDDRLRRAPTEGRVLSGDPPLLLVKVYQESMTGLLKLNSELEGLKQLESQQQVEMDRVSSALSDLSVKESEYERLQRAVDTASSALELYGKKLLDEQITSDLLASRIGSLRIVQKALQPTEPSFPRLGLIAPIGLLIALLGACFVCLGIDLLRPPPAGTITSPTPSDARGDPAVFRSPKQDVRLGWAVTRFQRGTG